VSGILVAGIGNVFLGDDAFGVEAAATLKARPLPPEIEVMDFGTRGFDLAMALGEPWAAAILLDAAPRGARPGTLYLLDLRAVPVEVGELPQGHGLDPVRVLGLLALLEIERPPLYLLGCEPGAFVEHEDAPAMSAEVRAAIEPAADMAESLALRLLHGAEQPSQNRREPVSRVGQMVTDPAQARRLPGA
jgi:hydrogenase maturation protease